MTTAGGSWVRGRVLPCASAVQSCLAVQEEHHFLRIAAAAPPPARVGCLVDVDCASALELSEDEAAALGQALGQRPVFVAGRLFTYAAVWHDRLQPPAFVARWLHDGYSEYLQAQVPFVVKANAPFCKGNEPFVTKEVQDLLQCGAVEDITALGHDRGSCGLCAATAVRAGWHQERQALLGGI